MFSRACDQFWLGLLAKCEKEEGDTVCCFGKGRSETIPWGLVVVVVVVAVTIPKGEVGGCKFKSAACAVVCAC